MRGAQTARPRQRLRRVARTACLTIALNVLVMHPTSPAFAQIPAHESAPPASLEHTEETRRALGDLVTGPWEKRWRASEALAAVGSSAHRSLLDLVEQHPDDRDIAFLVVHTLSMQGRLALDPLLELIGDPFVSHTAALAIRDLGVSALGPALEYAAQHKDLTAIDSTIEALIEGNEAYLWRLLASEDPESELVALRGMPYVLQRLHTDTLPPFTAAHINHPDVRVRRAVAAILAARPIRPTSGHRPPSPDFAKQLLTLLNDPDAEVRSNALRSRVPYPVEYHEAIQSRVRALLNDDVAEVRRAALERIQSHASMEQWIRPLLEDPDHVVRLTALEKMIASRLLPRDGDAGLLLDLHLPTRITAAGWFSGSQEYRRQAFHLLLVAAMGQPSEHSRAALGQILAHRERFLDDLHTLRDTGSPEERCIANAALHSNESRAPAMLSELVTMLEFSSLRCWALRRLAGSDIEAIEALPRCLEILARVESEAETTAMLSFLQSVGPAAREAGPWIQGNQDSPSPRVRRLASRTLEMIHDDPQERIEARLHRSTDLIDSQQTRTPSSPSDVTSRSPLIIRRPLIAMDPQQLTGFLARRGTSATDGQTLILEDHEDAWAIERLIAAKRGHGTGRLYQLTRHANPFVRADALRAMAHSTLPSVRAAAMAASGDPVPQVRREAVRLLLSNAQATPPPAAWLQHAILDASIAVRLEVVRGALRRLPWRYALSLVLPALAEGDPAIDAAMISSIPYREPGELLELDEDPDLGHLRDAVRQVPLRYAFLTRPEFGNDHCVFSRSVARAAHRALMTLGRVQSIDSDIMQLVELGDDDLRSRALDLLGHIRVDSTDVLGKLASLANRSDDENATRAAQILEAADPFFRKHEPRRDPGTAVSVDLANIAPAAVRSHRFDSSVLVGLLNAPQPEQRFAAIEMLTDFPTRRGAAALRDFARRRAASDPEGLAAARALFHCGYVAPLEDAAKWLSQENALKAYSIHQSREFGTITMQRGHAEKLEALRGARHTELSQAVSFFRNKHLPLSYVVALMHRRAHLGCERAVFNLFERAARGEARSILPAAARSLGNGPSSREFDRLCISILRQHGANAIPALLEIATFGAAHVRETATAALLKMEIPAEVQPSLARLVAQNPRRFERNRGVRKLGLNSVPIHIAAHANRNASSSAIRYPSLSMRSIECLLALTRKDESDISTVTRVDLESAVLHAVENFLDSDVALEQKVGLFVAGTLPLPLSEAVPMLQRHIESAPTSLQAALTGSMRRYQDGPPPTEALLVDLESSPVTLLAMEASATRLAFYDRCDSHAPALFGENLVHDDRREGLLLRKVAAEGIKLLGQRAAPLLPMLQVALKSPHAARQEVIQALAAIGHDGLQLLRAGVREDHDRKLCALAIRDHFPEAWNELLQSLVANLDAETPGAQESYTTLHEIATCIDEEQLWTWLEHPDRGRRTVASVLLPRSIRGRRLPDEQSRQIAVAMRETLRHPVLAREAVQSIVQNRLYTNRIFLGVLLEAFSTADRELAARITAVLSRDSSRETRPTLLAGLPMIIGCLGNAERGPLARSLLLQLGKPALPALLDAFSSTDNVDARVRILEIAATMGPAPPEVLALLEETAARVDEHARVRKEAAELLLRVRR